MTRTDIHRPAAEAFDPEAYVCLGAFDNHPEEGDPTSRREAVAMLVAKGYRFGAGGSDNCGHCGARIRYAALMVREDVREFIFVGETCLTDRFEGLTAAEFKRLRTTARLNRERATKAERIADLFFANPGLEGALAVDHYIINDIAARLNSRGEISEAQINLVFKLAREEDVRAVERARREEAAAAAIAAGVKVPTGRLSVTGEVLTVKWQDSQFGGSLKMLVGTAEGWKVWGTVPGSLEVEKGDTVTFMAQVEPSENDPLFGFFKRPTKAALLTPAG